MWCAGLKCKMFSLEMTAGGDFIGAKVYLIGTFIFSSQRLHTLQLFNIKNVHLWGNINTI